MKFFYQNKNNSGNWKCSRNIMLGRTLDFDHFE